MTRLGCHRFRSKEVRLGLSVIAYNLGGCRSSSVMKKEKNGTMESSWVYTGWNLGAGWQNGNTC